MKSNGVRQRIIERWILKTYEYFFDPDKRKIVNNAVTLILQKFYEKIIIHGKGRVYTCTVAI